MELPFDETSNFDVVFLSARITQTEHKMLTEIHGWLQTENQTATIRKQEAVRRTIRMAYAYLQTQLEHMDNQPVDTETQFVDNSPTPDNVVEISPTKPTQRNVDNMIETYKEIGNKSSYEFRAQNVHKTNSPDRALEFQRKLGLSNGR